jgi:4'-phosphopantetheinyl transferase
VEEVEIHCFSLDVGAARVRELKSSLTSEERDRAARFRFERDRDRFIACRGRLRELLGVRPDEEFVYGRFGKPRLEGSEVRFNVSHAHGMGMIAIARAREVGCDIERVDPAFADDKIPERFFSPYEVNALRALPEGEQCRAFFRCWTRKEAFIKACGMGLQLALDSFDVTLGPDEPAAFLRGAEGWSLHSVDTPAGFIAAMVLADQPAITMPTNSLI